LANRNVLYQTRDDAGALENYRRAASIEEPIASGAGANSFFRTHLAGDYHGLGRMLWRTGDTEQALQVSKKGLQILQQLSQADPNNATLREYVRLLNGKADATPSLSLLVGVSKTKRVLQR
jgi:hypothetical protein